MIAGKGTALITGATSGIGAAFAKRLARDGYDLVITGRREEKIRHLADEISSSYSVRVEVVIAELSNPLEAERLAGKIRSTGNLEVLVNNAGFGSRMEFHREDVEEQAGMLKVHTLVPLVLTHAAIPAMVARQSGAIINVSSVSGFLVSPRAAVYAATKSFLVTFSEGLSMELGEKGVRVQALCPGFTRTDFHDRLGWDEKKKRDRWIVRWQSADEVVEYSLRCLAKNRVICIPGFWNRLAVRFLGWLPRRLYYETAIRLRSE
jgi:short-subunit dehydrogenase